MTLVLALLHALAADIDVPAGSDLAAVVDAAADGDRLLLADGQFDASGVELDGRDLTLIGQGSALTVISGATLVVGDGTVQLAELTVDGAGERRALELTTGAVTLDGVLVSGGRDLLGGGVHSEGGTVVLRDSSFIDNQSFPFSGAHVYAVGGTVACERTTFEAGIARVVGTVRLDAADGTFTDCDFVGNTTEQAWTEGGGALYVSGGTLSVVGGLFSGNVAEGVGGGISAGQAATVHVVGARFEGNRASSGGGMACLEADSCSVLASEFDGNTAERGGGAYFRSVPDVLVEAGLFCENHAEGGDGGALYLDEVTGNVLQTWLLDNVADGLGGAAVSRDSNLAIQNGTWIDNAAPDAPALFGEQGSIDVVNTAVLHHAGDDPAVDLSEGEHSVRHVLWFGNGVDGAPIGELALLADPGFSSDARHACDPALLVPPDGSPLIDAGDPAILDPDGSPSDIGAAQGQSCPAEPACPDEDLDGHGDPVRATSVCDLPSGWLRAPCDDCDDLDGSIHPGASDLPNELDRDCSGTVVALGYGTGCSEARGCSGNAAWMMVLPLPLLARRRR